MEPKLILLLIVFAVFIYFKYGAGSRLLKKKSHHHIEPPTTTSDINWIPIDMKAYEAFIFAKSPEGLGQIAMHTEEIQLLFPTLKFEIIPLHGWEKITFEKSSFNDFHEMVMICDEINTGNVWGFCKHSKDSNQDYIVINDEKADHPHLIGAFRTNENFGIYLPKSTAHIYGNMSRSKVKEFDFDAALKQIETIVKDKLVER